MNSLISVCWFFIGIIWVIAGKPMLEVAACFIVCGIFSGAHELWEMRREMEDWEEDDM